jgi:hypothetical protein
LIDATSKAGSALCALDMAVASKVHTTTVEIRMRAETVACVIRLAEPRGYNRTMSAPHENTEVTRCANDLSVRLALNESSFEAGRQHAEPEYAALLNAVRQLHARFAFDPDGRPGAVGAVREALPAMERDLFDAVLEDHACEVAAIEEALYQLARALAQRTV